jgi:septal ring factor EnvC (AmiA/AmiB activator)
VRLVATLLAALAAFAPALALAQNDPAASARAAIEALAEASVALTEAEDAQDRVAALTRTVQAYEAGLAAMREGLRRATIGEATLRGVFEAESDRLSRLLGVLQSIEAAPRPTMLFHPDGPLGSARSGMILAEIAPALNREVEGLRAQMQEIAVLRALQESALGVLEEGLAGVQEARTRLSLAISDRTDLPRRFNADEAAMRQLVDSAETLESFASGLLTVEKDGVETAVTLPDFASARGQLALPVFGTRLRRFGEADAAGIRRPGWIVATRPLALVTTPWPATIRYLGPLLDYGNVAILEPGEGFLIVLAGLGQTFGSLGEVLPRGAAVGLMGGAEADSQAFLIAPAQGGGTDSSETLYIEIRENGTPADPAGWFAGS